MSTTTLDTLEQKLSKAIDDWIEEDTTTNIAAGNSVISTSLKQWDKGQDGYFIDWWIYITEGNNIGVERQISDYDTDTGTLTVRGAALAAEAGPVTFRLYRYRRTDKVDAINDAILEIYPSTQQRLDNMSLITGNLLPDFEWWTSSSLLKFYSTNNVTLAKTTTPGLYWGPQGTISAKATASAADGYIYISSDSWRRLLHATDRVVTLKVWAYPEVANDASCVIYTISKDGTTTQTLASATSNPAGFYTLLELEDETLNGDLEEIQVRLKVKTGAKYVYFSAPRLIVDNVFEYLLPEKFQDGEVDQVYIQAIGDSDDACDDQHPAYWTQIYDWEILNDGTYKYLRLPSGYSNERRIRLIGHKPLSALSETTDTIEIANENIRPLIAYAAYLLFDKQIGTAEPSSIARYQGMAAYWLAKYKQLHHLAPDKAIRTMKLPSLG